MSEHKLPKTEEQRKEQRAKWNKIKQIAPSKGALLWDSRKLGTFNRKKLSKKGKVL